MSTLWTPENAGLGGGLSPKTKRGQALRRYLQLTTDRSSWRSHWIEISDYILPRRGRFLHEAMGTRGRKRTSKIVDSTAGLALRTLQAGMISGLSNPARPWFKLATADPDRDDSNTAKEWLDQAARGVRIVLHRSNFYNAISNFYSECGSFGTAALFRQATKDKNRFVHYRPLTAGEYVIAEDEEQIVDTIGREFQMTVAQIVDQFLADPAYKTIDWSKASPQIKNAWDRSDYDQQITVVHMIQPRRPSEYDPERGDAMNMPWKSCYLEYGAEHDQLLEESGYRKFPAYVGRWDMLAGDVYGRSPGMEALGDIKQLQLETKRKAQAIDKMVNPPLNADPSMKGKASSTLPGALNYKSGTDPNGGLSPVYMVQPRIGELSQDIAEIQDRIQRTFYADLFAMMINSDRRQITATEVAERHEEKLVLLGPVLQRLNVEVFNHVIEDAFDIAVKAGLVPPAPPELEGTDLEIKYISLLAQAQEAVSATAIERGMGFAANVASFKPDALDLINADEALRQYFDLVGVSPTLIKDEDEVQATREARAQKEAQMEQLAAAEQMSGTAKNLAQSPIDSAEPNALERILGGGQRP